MNNDDQNLQQQDQTAPAAPAPMNQPQPTEEPDMSSVAAPEQTPVQPGASVEEPVVQSGQPQENVQPTSEQIASDQQNAVDEARNSVDQAITGAPAPEVPPAAGDEQNGQQPQN